MRKSSGQSMVEVIVVVGAMSLLLVSLLSLVALSIKNSRLAKDRTRAVSLSVEGVELMRSFRDYSWQSITGVARNDPYDLPKNWVIADGLSSDCDAASFLIYNFFRRCVTILQEDSQTLTVEVEVSWMEGNKLNQTTQPTKLTVWER